MALKWAWGFSTDQSRAKLNEMGFGIASGYTSVNNAQVHSYPGDNVAKRSSLQNANHQYSYSPYGTAAFDGWVCASLYVISQWSEYSHPCIGVHQSGLTGIYVVPAGPRGTSNAMKLYVDSTFKATSATTYLVSSWHYFALKYEGSTTTFKATLYINGVEAIAEQTDTATTAWTDASLMRMYHSGPSYGYYTYYGGYVTYDSTSDSGEVEVWCSTYEPQTDDAETGTWAPSTGATNFGVITPWDVATYTEEVSPTTGDKFTCGYTDSIATRLGITPTIHAVVSQQAVSGGSDFKALLDVGSGDVVGAAVTSDTNDPTYGYSIETSGITASSTVKIGIKIP